MVEVLVGDRRTNRCHQSVISAAVGASELAEADQKSGQKALKYREVPKKRPMHSGENGQKCDQFLVLVIFDLKISNYGSVGVSTSFKNVYFLIFS